MAKPWSLLTKIQMKSMNKHDVSPNYTQVDHRLQDFEGINSLVKQLNSLVKPGKIQHQKLHPSLWPLDQHLPMGSHRISSTKMSRQVVDHDQAHSKSHKNSWPGDSQKFKASFCGFTHGRSSQTCRALQNKQMLRASFQLVGPLEKLMYASN